MNVLKKTMLGAALAMGTVGAITVAPQKAQAAPHEQAALFEVYGNAFPTAAAAAAALAALPHLQTTPWGPSFVAFKPTGSNGPGFYICVAVGP